MPSNGDSNLDRLTEAGLIRDDEPLPEPFEHLVAGLTPDEVDILVAVKTRLDGAASSHGLEPSVPGQLPPFTNFMVF
ncbi:MAG TPA: aroma-sacti cluster domain-containing protein [Gaiellaceae bacterium]|jgi:hypothetical protein|nr:aroma-sacti cluster domain-containing protein [Gaiellaceae bacterium]